MDANERIVPNDMELEFTECACINKDVKVSGSSHFTGLRIQVKHGSSIQSLHQVNG